MARIEVRVVTPSRAATPRAPGVCRAILAALLVALVMTAAARPAWCGWQTFGIADGLAGAQVRAIAEDGAGRLWFATAHGASVYDGAVWRTFTMADGLASDDVRALLTDRAGRLWFGTSGGVTRFDGSAWNTFTISDGLASDNVLALLEDRAGRLWVATAFGVSGFDGTGWVSYHQADGLAANEVSCLLEDRAGDLWFGTRGGGVSRFDGSDWTTYTKTQGLADNWVESILEDRSGVLWLGTRYGGLSRFDGHSWRTWTSAAGLTLADVTALREDRSGMLWVGSSTGVARFDGLSWRAYTTAAGLASSFVSALLFDDSGDLWVGTDNGASRHDRVSWTSFVTADLGSYGAQALLEDRTGAIWAATGGAGVARYDRTSWTSYRAADGLAGDRVAAVVEDSTGAIWFGTSAGATRYDGVAWRTYTVADGLAGNDVRAVARDASGRIWFGTTSGLSRFDGASWRSYTHADGLASDLVRSLRVDRAGRVWCGTNAGASRLDGATWTSFSTADGLADPNVHAILEDRSGTMWLGTRGGLCRFDGVAWTTFTVADGLAGDWVLCVAEDRDDVLWIGTAGGGISRFDGSLWHTYSTADGLPDGTVSAAMQERSGDLWFGTAGGAVLHEPDRVPPQTVITSPPPALSANTLQVVRYAAAFRELVGIEYASSFDGEPWSPWSPDQAWLGRDLPDGTHSLHVRARDGLHHVDLTPAVCAFEVDATPPTPVLTVPVFRQPVRDTLLVRGTATDSRFRSLRVDLRPAGAGSWDPPDARLLAQSTAPVTDGALARLDTRSEPDGEYELRLSVADTLGLTGVTLLTFIIDNEPPWASQTSPALVSAETGGDVYTTHDEAHLYIPPHALARDAVARLDPLEASAVPAVMPDGAIRAAPGFAVTLEGVPLAKTATLDMSVAEAVVPAGTRLVLYAAEPDSAWRRLGGTLDAGNRRLAAPISAAARYALCGESRAASGPGALSSLALTPRVFSPQGGFASTIVGISFVLARPAATTVSVYNRAGRLVREVASGRALGAGANLVGWDGCDESGRMVEDGIYVVAVEALGETTKSTVAVVR